MHYRMAATGASPGKAMSDNNLHAAPAKQAAHSPITPVSARRTRRAAPKPAVQAAMLRTAEACAYLNIGRSTLHRLVTEGRIKPVRIGRMVSFTRAELDQFIANSIAA